MALGLISTNKQETLDIFWSDEITRGLDFAKEAALFALDWFTPVGTIRSIIEPLSGQNSLPVSALFLPLAILTPQLLKRIKVYRRIFGKRLALARERLSRTEIIPSAEIARRLNVNSSTYCRFESGQALPGYESCRDLETILSLPEFEVLKWKRLAQHELGTKLHSGHPLKDVLWHELDRVEHLAGRGKNCGEAIGPLRQYIAELERRPHEFSISYAEKLAENGFRPQVLRGFVILPETAKGQAVFLRGHFREEFAEQFQRIAASRGLPAPADWFRRYGDEGVEHLYAKGWLNGGLVGEKFQPLVERALGNKGGSGNLHKRYQRAVIRARDERLEEAASRFRPKTVPTPAIPSPQASSPLERIETT